MQKSKEVGRNLNFSLLLHYNTANISDLNRSQSNSFLEPDLRHGTFFQVQFAHHFQVIIPDSIFKIFILF